MLTKLIERHYADTGKVYPDTWQALAWAITELGEVYELLLNEDLVGWVRNHPDDKEPYSPERLEEGLGDVLMMVQVAGQVRGLDPFKRLCKDLSPPPPIGMGNGTSGTTASPAMGNPWRSYPCLERRRDDLLPHSPRLDKHPGLPCRDAGCQDSQTDLPPPRVPVRRSVGVADPLAG